MRLPCVRYSGIYLSNAGINVTLPTFRPQFPVQDALFSPSSLVHWVTRSFTDGHCWQFFLPPLPSHPPDRSMSDKFVMNINKLLLGTGVFHASTPCIRSYAACIRSYAICMQAAFYDLRLYAGCMHPCGPGLSCPKPLIR